MPLRCTGARLTLASRRFDPLVLFYRQLLNLEPAVLIPNVYAEFHLPALKLGIFRPRKAQHPQDTPHSRSAERSRRSSRRSPLPTPRFGTSMSLCLDVDNLETAVAHLTQLGYPPPGHIMTASHGREIYAYDPEGNGLILHQATITYNEG